MQEELQNKQEFVYSQLRDRILSGHWTIGDQISTEDQLSTEFRCSRGTISRAVARLVQEKLVERKTRSGTRVISNSISRSASTLDLDACAFIHPSDQHEGVWRTERGFQQAAHSAKRRTFMLSTGTDFRREAEIVGRLIEFNVKGAVLFPVILTPQEMAYYTQMICACPLPIVLVELNIPGIGRPSVVVDGLHAGYTMTRHLLQQGLRRIGFLANYAWAPYIRDRYLGYRQALEEAGVPFDESCVSMESAMRPNFEDPLQDSIRSAHQYLDKNTNLEGVVCSHDFIALGLMQAAQARGIRIPESLKVTGIDDYGISSVGEVPLTTYRVPYEKIGQQAFETLNILMRGETCSPLETQVRGEIVVRQSA